MLPLQYHGFIAGHRHKELTLPLPPYRNFCTYDPYGWLDEPLYRFRKTLHDAGLKLIHSQVDNGSVLNPIGTMVDHPYLHLPEESLELFTDPNGHVRAACLAGMNLRQTADFENGVATVHRLVSRPMHHATKADYLVLERMWNADWLIDPRLTAAEQFIEHHSEWRDPQYETDDTLFRRNLMWLACPDNAKRVGKAVLYSALAPHFHLGEKDMQAFVERLTTHPDGVGQIIEGVRKPNALYVDVMSDATQRRSGIGGWLSRRREIFTNAVYNLTARDDSLVQMAPQIVEQYSAVCNSTWARAQLGLSARDPHTEFKQARKMA